MLKCAACGHRLSHMNFDLAIAAILATPGGAQIGIDDLLLYCPGRSSLGCPTYTPADDTAPAQWAVRPAPGRDVDNDDIAPL